MTITGKLTKWQDILPIGESAKLTYWQRIEIIQESERQVNSILRLVKIR